ncbi:aminoglycoside phosphotransferase family protein [Streptomyces sp. NPDC048623]|uniref:phosphotransferase family protein n=1 Tax=Streptomyces sp. NPDC048623 TaxID=3155761 RepID=UPI00342A4107
MDDTALLQLHDLARAAAHPGEPAGVPCPCRAGLLADRADGTVVRHGRLVLKAHGADGDPAALRARISVAALPALEGILLPPLPEPPESPAAARRSLSLWPYGTPVDPEDPGAAPWEAAGRLLAGLHRSPAPPGTPPMRAPLKVSLAVDRMCQAAPDHPATPVVLRAWATVPAVPAPDAALPSALCHGDFHLGQLVRLGEPGRDPRWRLIDVDDLGLGDPAWDLARPAAWFAAGLLSPEVWSRFLGAYEAAGGPATRGPATRAPDPWARLDVPARALTVQTAALAVAKSTAEGRPLDEVEDVMIDTCARIGSLRTELPPAAST